MKAALDFIFLGSRITVNSDCSHEIEKNTCSWKKNHEKLSILKRRDITLHIGPYSHKLWFFQGSWMNVRVEHKES